MTTKPEWIIIRIWKFAIASRRSSDGKWTINGHPVPWLCIMRGDVRGCICKIAIGAYAITFWWINWDCLRLPEVKL